MDAAINGLPMDLVYQRFRNYGDNNIIISEIIWKILIVNK